MQEEAKRKIEKLIERYEKLSPLQKREYNESMTSKDFILPLFEALGWDVYNKHSNNEVSSEIQISGKRADYTFCINDVTHFFLEAKKINTDLREERWSTQVVMYSWHKSVPWAILTDFESIRVFNSEWDEPDPERSLLFEIKYTEYLTDKRLWWLSKESIGKGELDKYAEINFRKPKRNPVDVQLANDLLRWRDLLFKNVRSWNSEKLLTNDQYAEAVQKLLNRLIFIKTTEDRGFEDQRLREILRNWKKNESETDYLQRKLKELFRFYWGCYDSKLFKKHICDVLEYEDYLIAQIINELYKNQKGIRYNFASINADVFGSVYEQYLGHIQQEKKDQNKSKRKSQGIYYTPLYIVEYIINNTLGIILKDKSGHEATKIRILDPACGSGSFLIKAFDALDKHIARENIQRNAHKAINYARKISILTTNIYGVDLDEEAVEIASLNLLLKALEERCLLPNLSHNVECGNSLVEDGTNFKKYFGKNRKNKKPFNWQLKFPDVMRQGGFDVVVGNPPYIDSEEMSREDQNLRKYCVDRYSSARGNWDIFCVFLQSGLNLLKESGYLGMIIPNKLLSANYAKAVRDIIYNFSIIAINDYSNIRVFSGASVYPIVIIVQKEKPDTDHQLEINTFKETAKGIELENSKKINQTDLKNYKKSWSPIFSFSKNSGLIDKLINEYDKLNKFCDVHGAATVNEAYRLKELIKNKESKESDEIFFKFINTGTIDRFLSLWATKKTQYIKSSYLEPVVSKNKLKEMFPTRYNQSDKPKIIIAGMAKKLECYLDEVGDYLAGKSTVIVECNDLDLEYIIALLNSRLMTYFYKNYFRSLSLAGGFLRFGSPQIQELPIAKTSEKNRDRIVQIVKKIIKLKDKLQKLDPILDEEEYNFLDKKVKLIDKELDQMVYDLYSLTKDEIKIVEENR